MKTKKIALCGVLTALALGLSYTERFLPLNLLIPLPGIKLGLANVVTLVALYLLGKKYALGILITRCVLGGLFGGLTGMVFSLVGGALSFGAMVLSYKSRGLSVYGVSVIGAATHNIGQILVAMGLMGSYFVALYLPWLLLAGLVTGLATGGICAGILKILPDARQGK